MRLKRHEIIVSSIISILSFLLAFLLLVYNLRYGAQSKTVEFLSSAFLGVFGSAFVLLLLSSFEYRRAKQSSMRAFCSSVYAVLDQLSIPDYIHLRENEAIVIEAIREKENRPSIQKLREREVKEHPEIADSPDFLVGAKQIAAQLDYAEEIKRVRQTDYPPGVYIGGSQRCFFDEADEATDYWIDRVSKLVSHYRSIAKTDLFPLDNCFYDLGFFTDLFRRKKNRIKTRIGNEIVDPIHKGLDAIRRTTREFDNPTNPLDEEVFSRSTTMKRILALQKQLFINHEYDETECSPFLGGIFRRTVFDVIRKKTQRQWDSRF